MPPPRGIVQQIDRRLHRSQLLPRGARLLVAVSGGADSVALLRILADINGSDYWHWKLIIAHIDHGIRGRASAADARFVKGLAGELGLPIAVKRLRLGESASEDAARQARLRAYEAIARRHRCTSVVLAHHADDQAETVLMRMFRGTGISGLAAMGPDSQIGNMLWLVRPLLEVRRTDLRAYLDGIGQPWREDSTNQSPLYLRNRVRAALLPLVESLWPQAVPALCRLATLAAENHEVVFMAAGRLLNAASRHGSHYQIDRSAVRQAPAAVATEALRMLIECAGGSVEAASFERLREALHLICSIAGGKRIEMGRGVSVTLRGNRVEIARDTVRRRRG